MTSRPQHHLAPAAGWLNDPNGLAFHDGRWHAFYQHNPAGPVHDAIAWGHASSGDLVRWRHHPVAFAPTPGGPDRFGCWSGVYVDGLDRPTVVYSGVVDDGFQSTVCLRHGSDDLDTWSDPVVVAETPDTDDITVMRDPFVFTWGGRRWALLGAALTGVRAGVLLYSCDDMLAWRYEGVLLTSDDPIAGSGRPADIWECPQLLVEGDDALLVLSIQLEGRLDTVQGVRGRLVAGPDGRPVFEPHALEVVDGGNAMYAPQAARDPHGWWLLGWVREDGNDVGDPANAGCLTYPRRWSAAGWSLAPTVLAAAPEFVETPSPVDLSTPSCVRSTAAWRLRGDTVDVTGDAADVWVDGEVVEVYPHDGSAPSTYRDAGCGSWQVTAITSGTEAAAGVLSVAAPAPSTP